MGDCELITQKCLTFNQKAKNVPDNRAAICSESQPVYSLVIIVLAH